MQTVREPTLPVNREPESTAKPAVRAEAVEPRPGREPRWTRLAAPAALGVLLLTALAVGYVTVVVPAALAVLFAAWIGSMGLVVALPLLVVAAAAGVVDGRHPRRATAPDEGLAGRRVG